MLLRSLSILLLFGITVSAAQTNDECLACHSDNSLTMEKKGKTVSLFVNDKHLGASPHKKFSCTSCHTGFDPNNMPHKENITPVQCQTCHSKDVQKHAFHKTVVATGNDKSSMCKDCHGTHDVVSPRVAGAKFNKATMVEDCGTCHTDQKDHFLRSSHGQAFTAKVKDAPTCLECHSVLYPSSGKAKDAAELKLQQERMCMSCHGGKVSTQDVAGEFVHAYEQSVHANALKKGNGKAATCVDCHSSHDMLKGSDLASTVNKKNIPNTCSQCHGDVVKTYSASIHGKAFANGNTASAVCTDCHGEHKILGAKDPNSPVSGLHVSEEVCAPCHSSVKMSEKFGLPTGRLKTFNDSFHGLAVKSGSKEAANCASCHGYHDILPSSDSLSRVSKKNLAATCGTCHPGAGENFAVGTVHVTTQADSEDELIYFVSNIYVVLIVVTIGGMAIHNILDFVRKSKRRLRHRRHGYDYEEEEETTHALYVRMTLGERLQHGALALSFILLVITGFMLRYPDAWWVAGIRSLSESIFDIRGILHRTSAVVMILASLYHIYYVLFVPRGKQLIRDLLPKIQDAYDALNVAKYNLGISKEKPLLDRFSYIEKAEYWALIWGTIVMGITGFILWFDVTFINIIGKQWWDIARVVHYYEAWLATLAIIVWHFYFIIFNPDVYPMNLAWLKGTISEEEMADEHPLELRRIKEAELKEKEEQQKQQQSKNAGTN
ncbi:MAG: cytochrome b/b6 domain-containing protein [Bacteroidetes bacterium]|nr:cytochrome b/b6 domain-containing protein [Bacteroidota bacterium]